jgi:hypothetical protein
MTRKLRFRIQSRFEKLFRRYTWSTRQNSCFVSGNFEAVTGHSWGFAWFYPVPPVNTGTVPHIRRRSLLAASFPVLHSRFNAFDATQTELQTASFNKTQMHNKYRSTVPTLNTAFPDIAPSSETAHDTLWTAVPYSRLFRQPQTAV